MPGSQFCESVLAQSEYFLRHGVFLDGFPLSARPLINLAEIVVRPGVFRCEFGCFPGLFCRQVIMPVKVKCPFAEVHGEYRERIKLQRSFCL